MEQVLQNCEGVLQPSKDLEFIRRIINDAFVSYAYSRFGQSMNVKTKLPESMEPWDLRKFFREVDLSKFWFGDNGFLLS